jgi:hypothetical protein
MVANDQAFRDDLNRLLDMMRRQISTGDFGIIFARYTPGPKTSKAERAYAAIINDVAGQQVSVAWLLARLETI